MRLRNLAVLSLVFLAGLLPSTSPSAAADWPQFQGPNRDGTTSGQGIARSWSGSVPRQLWSIPLGEGFGGAAIRDGEVYVLDRVGTTNDVLRCLSLETGSEIWSVAYDAPGSVSHHGSRATPTVTDGHVYSVGMTGHLYCIDRKTHEPAWHRDLARDFPPVEDLKWGYSQAPIVHGDLVIVAPQSRKGWVVAFNRLNGDEIWASPTVGSPGYSSPIVVDAGGVEHIAMINAGRPGVSGISITDGSLLWQYQGWNCRIPIPYPTQLPDDRLFVTGEYGAGSAMIRITRQGSTFSVEELFVSDECESQIHQPLYYDGHLYMNSNGNTRNDGMLCLALDGTVRWRTRDTRGTPRFERGGLLMADGLIINLDGQDGALHLIEPTPEGYRELARANVLQGNQAWSPMALSEGRLVLRDMERMVCLDLRGE